MNGSQPRSDRRGLRWPVVGERLVVGLLAFSTAGFAQIVERLPVEAFFLRQFGPNGGWAAVSVYSFGSNVSLFDAQGVILATVPWTVAGESVGDVDGDGRWEFPVLSQGSLQLISPATLLPIWTLPPGSGWTFMGDVTGDGVQDLGRNIPYLEFADGRTAAPLPIVPGWPAFIHGLVPDMDGDGRADFIADGPIVNRTDIRSFATGAVVRSFSNSSPIRPDVLGSPGDVDGDGSNDVVVNFSDELFWPGPCYVNPWCFTATHQYGFVGPFSNGLGDLDGDGIPEWFGTWGACSAGVYSGVGSHWLLPLPGAVATTEYDKAQALGDVDGDGHDDIGYRFSGLNGPGSAVMRQFAVQSQTTVEGVPLGWATPHLTVGVVWDPEQFLTPMGLRTTCVVPPEVWSRGGERIWLFGGEPSVIPTGVGPFLSWLAPQTEVLLASWRGPFAQLEQVWDLPKRGQNPGEWWFQIVVQTSAGFELGNAFVFREGVRVTPHYGPVYPIVP